MQKDIPEVKKYGEDYINSVISLIRKYNQNIYLHLHPDYITGDHNRSFLWQYSFEEKKTILKEGFELYKKYVGEDVTSFRIGRYGADEDMYKALDELGYSVKDLSYCYNNPHMCHLPYEKVCSYNKVTKIHNQYILPNTRYIGLIWWKRDVCIGIDADNTTFNEFCRYLNSSHLNSITITMHSWEFIKKVFFLKKYICLNKSKQRKFERMIEFAKAKGYVFSDLKESFDPNDIEEQDELIDMCSGIKGKIMMFPNNFERFGSIALLDRKYFVIYSFFYIIVTILLMGLLVVLLK